MSTFRYLLITLLALSSSSAFSQGYTLDDAAEKRWHIKEVLADTNTMHIAKTIYLGLDHKNFSEMDMAELQSVMDSLPHMGMDVKGFYFMVIAKSYVKVEGRYADNISYSSKAYVDSNLIEFLNYFTGDGKLPGIYLQKWAAIVANQFEAIKVDQNPKVLAKLSKYYDARCKACRSPQKAVLKQYEDLIKAYVK